MSTRTGKIARLPRWIRNRLNQRLDDGEEGKKLVRWLNRLPEVRAVMGESFAGKPVTEQNLSEWKAGGFEEWVGRQEFLEQARELAEDAEELRSVAGKGQFSFSEHLSTVLAMRYARVLQDWQGEAGEGMTKQLRLLHGLSHDVARLARVGLERQKVELTREKSQAELVDLFSEWMEIPAVREAYEEDAQGPGSEVQSRSGRKLKGKRGAYGGRERNRGTRGAFRDTRGGCGPRAGKHSTAESRPGINIQQLMSNGRGNGRKPSSAGHPSPSIPLPSEGRGKTCRDNFTSEPLRTKSGRRRWLKDPTACDALGRDLPEVKAAAQKQLAEDLSRYYIPKRPGCEEQGTEKNNGVSRTYQRGNNGSKPLTPSLSPLGRGEGEKGRLAPGSNPAQSDLIVPPAMEAEVARLNRGGECKQGNGNEGNYGTNGAAEGDGEDRPDWDPEDEMILKEAAAAHQRREAARKVEAEKQAEEEYRLWRVDFGFEEPTEEDIALGRTKRKRWNKAEQENANIQHAL